MTPPLALREAARYFVWIVLLTLAMAALFWFTGNPQPRQSIRPARNTVHASPTAMSTI